jgi:hypothetical protein
MKFIGGIVNIFKNMLQKKLSKKTFSEKIKMFKKGPFVVESFVIIGSFDYVCTPLRRTTPFPQPIS